MGRPGPDDNPHDPSCLRCVRRQTSVHGVVWPVLLQHQSFFVARVVVHVGACRVLLTEKYLHCWTVWSCSEIHTTSISTTLEFVPTFSGVCSRASSSSSNSSTRYMIYIYIYMHIKICMYVCMYEYIHHTGSRYRARSQTSNC